METAITQLKHMHVFSWDALYKKVWVTVMYAWDPFAGLSPTYNEIGQYSFVGLAVMSAAIPGLSIKQLEEALAQLQAAQLATSAAKAVAEAGMSNAYTALCIAALAAGQPMPTP